MSCEIIQFSTAARVSSKRGKAIVRAAGMPIVKKATPSGSKYRVPAAPATGPLKSPVPSDLADPPPSKCELAHNRGLFFPKGRVLRSAPLA
jgi:hypothetical protein